MIQIAVGNETLARTIIRQANGFCHHRLTKERMALDVAKKLQSYVHMLGIHDNITRRHQWEDQVWKVYQRNGTFVDIVPPRGWWGIRHWNIPWRIAKPFYQLLQAAMDVVV
jgi:hypothetical protein